jgi:RNA polymerase sigma-70 factor (ECF subfamily)
MNVGGFDEFFRQETKALIAFVRRAAGVTQEQAQDAVQDAMIKAYPVWADLTSPRAWIRVAAYRNAVFEAARTQDGVLRAVAGGWTATTHHDPDVVVLNCEHEQLLRYLVDLPRRQRIVMAWHLDDFDNDEIAEQLQMAPATVRSNLRHARKALSSRLTRESTQ